MKKEKSERVIELRTEGWTLAGIANQVDETEEDVMEVLQIRKVGPRTYVKTNPEWFSE